MIADPAIDIGMILYTYRDTIDWQSWLATYGIEYTLDLEKRMKWYTIIQAIAMIEWYEEKSRYHDLNDWLKFLDDVLNLNRFI